MRRTKKHLGNLLLNIVLLLTAHTYKAQAQVQKCYRCPDFSTFTLTCDKSNYCPTNVNNIWSGQTIKEVKGNKPPRLGPVMKVETLGGVNNPGCTYPIIDNEGSNQFFLFSSSLHGCVFTSNCGNYSFYCYYE